MQNRNQALLAFLKDVLAVVGTASALVYYWGLVGVNAPLQARFGFSLPFISQQYWSAGLDYLFQIGLLIGIGLFLGLTMAARDPDLDKNGLGKALLLVGLMVSTLAYFAADFMVGGKEKAVCVSAALPGVGYAVGFMTAMMVHTYMFLSDNERKVAVIEHLIDKQQEALTERLNAPDLLKLRRGEPGDRLRAAELESVYDVQSRRIEEAEKSLVESQERRRQARLYVTAGTMIMFVVVAMVIPVTSRYVALQSLQVGLDDRYPIVQLITSTPIPELGQPTSNGAEHTYRVRFILRADGQVYVVSTESSQAAVIPGELVNRVIPLGVK